MVHVSPIHKLLLLYRRRIFTGWKAHQSVTEQDFWGPSWDKSFSISFALAPLCSTQVTVFNAHFLNCCFFFLTDVKTPYQMKEDVKYFMTIST